MITAEKLHTEMLFCHKLPLLLSLLYLRIFFFLILCVSCLHYLYISFQVSKGTSINTLLRIIGIIENIIIFMLF